MATLLRFSTDPSREALLEELVKKGVLAQVIAYMMQGLGTASMFTTPERNVLTTLAPVYIYNDSILLVYVYCWHAYHA